LTTFGFEAEFQTNAASVIAGLHERGRAGDSTLHCYHCDCDNCSFGSEYIFRGQTDSSCSGEIISGVMDWTGTEPEYARAVWTDLQDVAVEVDAEPGPNSGFHVHVGIGDKTRDELADILWQFLRWEPVLTRIAGGRWALRRDGMNRTVRDDLYRALEVYGGYQPTTEGLINMENDRPTGFTFDELKSQLYERHLGNDRHSNLNIAQSSHPTWEFRIWNSTRAAWRMEMYCGLSVALCDNEVVTGLAVLEPPRRFTRPATGIDRLAEACEAGGFTRTAELLQRQADYLTNRAETAPSVLTTL
jgi:hypothetical protein